MTTNSTVTKTPTKKDNFTAIKAFLEANGANETLIGAIDHELELLAKRADKPSKTEEQVNADKALMDEILAVLADGAPKTVSDMQKFNTALSLNAGVSCSKITSLLTRTLIPNGKVKREVIKRKAYYSLI